MLCFVLQELLISGSRVLLVEGPSFKRVEIFFRSPYEISQGYKILLPCLLMPTPFRLPDLSIPATLFISSLLTRAQKLVPIHCHLISQLSMGSSPSLSPYIYLPLLYISFHISNPPPREFPSYSKPFPIFSSPLPFP